MESTLFVGSLDKGLAVLRAFDRERRQMGLFEIVERTGLDKSAAQRFTHTLHALGYLAKDPSTKKYALSPKVLELGVAYLHAHTLLERAMPLLYEANRKCDETLNLSELLDTEVVYVARVPSRQVISVDIVLGMRIPAYACAAGRAILASLPQAEAEAVLARSDLVKITPKTLATKREVLDELARVRQNGYAFAPEQCYLGEYSAAVPILDGRGHPVAAINVSVPTSRWSENEFLAKLVPIVVETGNAISHGGVGGHFWSDVRHFARPASAPKRP